jgi:hypothetical protein
MNENVPIASPKLGPPTNHEMMVFQTMAKSAVDSKMYRGIGDQAGVMMLMLSARELGIPPCQALNGGLHIINGKVEISANMMNALIRKQGHKIKIKEISDESCTLMGIRADTGEVQYASFSVIEAQRAGLMKPGGGWEKYPRDMCFSRAISRLARQLFSDVIGIGYVDGEIKPQEAINAIPEDIELETPVDSQKEEETLQVLFQNLFHMFPKEDHLLLNEYMHVVMNHFGWSKKECFKKFLEDKDLISKFNTWKSKRKEELSL